jgi:hypothetical protein
MSMRATLTPEKKYSPLNVALVQLSCHPSLRIGANLLNCEPFLDSENPPPLQALWDRGFAVGAIQDQCRERYLVWQRARIEAVVKWLSELPPDEFPDVVVFPEGSIPRKFISCLHRKLQRRNGTHPLIFAGTHSFEHSPEARDDYRALNIEESELNRIARCDIDTVSVVPILRPDGKVVLRTKTMLSPWEYTAIGLSRNAEDAWNIGPSESIENGKSVLGVEALVCSEALQHIHTSAEVPDLVVILSYDRSPSQFRPLQEHYAKNRLMRSFGGIGHFW